MTHVTIEREALQAVLDTLEENHHLIEQYERSEYLALYDRQITVTKQALAVPTVQPVADGLIRQYITALVANKPDEAANATKGMVDYVYTTQPAPHVQEPEHLQQGVDALVSAAGTALEVLEKHRQMKGEAPMGMLGVRAMEELKKAFRLLYPQDDYEPPAAPVPLTEGQRSKMYRTAVLRGDSIMVRSDYELGIRDAEAAHNITKGGARPEEQRPV